jgi:hypothetical protein
MGAADGGKAEGEAGQVALAPRRAAAESGRTARRILAAERKGLSQEPGKDCPTQRRYDMGRSP